MTLPSRSDDAGLWIMQSANPVIVAVDVEGPGHITEYPTDVESVALQIPFRNGQIPKYELLHDGICAVGKQWESGRTKDSSDLRNGAQKFLEV